MGYVAAFKKQEFPTPAAIVITETAVDVLIFPFVDTGGDDRLLIAAHVSLDLWKADTKIEHNCLVLLAYLAFADLKQYKIVLSTAKDHEKMRRVEISTDTTSWQQQLEQSKIALALERKEKDKVIQENEAMQEQIRQLKRKLESESELEGKV